MWVSWSTSFSFCDKQRTAQLYAYCLFKRKILSRRHFMDSWHWNQIWNMELPLQKLLTVVLWCMIKSYRDLWYLCYKIYLSYIAHVSIDNSDSRPDLQYSWVMTEAELHTRSQETTNSLAEGIISRIRSWFCTRESSNYNNNTMKNKHSIFHYFLGAVMIYTNLDFCVQSLAISLKEKTR